MSVFERIGWSVAFLFVIVYFICFGYKINESVSLDNINTTNYVDEDYVATQIIKNSW